MEETYAKALVQADRGGDTEKTVTALIAHLKSMGRMKLLPGILRQLRILKARAKTLSSTLEVASEAEKEGAKKEAAALGITPEHVHVNHALIRGWRVRSAGVLVDRSAKRMLTDIYQNVVAGH